MSKKIQQHRGLEIDLPVLEEGQIGFTTDTKKLFIGSNNGNVEIISGERLESIISQIDLNTETIEEVVNAELNDRLSSISTDIKEDVMTEVRDIIENIATGDTVLKSIESNMPNLEEGKIGFTTDTKKVFIGSNTGNVEITSINPIISSLVANDTSANNKLKLEQLFASSASEIIIPEGTYTTSRINSGFTNKTIKGFQGKTILQTNDDTLIQMGTSENVIFQDITFVSLSTEESIYGVINILGSNVKNVKFINCTFKSRGSNGLKFVNESSAKSEFIAFEKCKFEDIGRMGVEFQNHNDDVELSRYSNISFKDCEFKNIGLGTDGDGMAISMSGLGEVITVSNCKFTDCGTAGVELIGAKYVNVDGNTFVGNEMNSFSPIAITNDRPNDYIIITNNKSFGNLEDIAIYTGKEVIFSNNIFHGIIDVYVKNTSYSKFTNNIIKSKGTYALMFDNSGYNEVIGNTLVTEDSNWSALRFYGENSVGNIINNNKLYIGDGGTYISEINGATDNDFGDNYYDNWKIERDIQQLRDLEEDLPLLAEGQFAFATDTKKVFIGSDEGNVEITTRGQSGEQDVNAILEAFSTIINTTDSSDNIINKLTSANTSVKFPNGEYVLSGKDNLNKIVITKPIKIVGDNAVVYLDGGIQLELGSPDIEVSGIDFRVRNHGSLNGGEACILVKRNNIKIDRCKFGGSVFYYGIAIDDTTVKNCDDLKITNCHFDNLGYGILKQDIEGLSLNRLLVSNCILTNILMGDAIELNVGEDIGYVIENNYIDNVRDGGILNAGIGIGIAGGRYGGDKLKQTREGFVRNNIIKNVDRCAIHFEACNKFDIVNNKVENDRTGHGIQVYGCTDFNINSNNVENFYTGIVDDLGVYDNTYIESTDNNHVTRNNVTDCDIGIYLGATGNMKTSYCKDNVVSKCVRGIKVYGKAIFEISNNLLEDCDISMDFDYEAYSKGSLFATRSRYVSIRNNTAKFGGLLCDKMNSNLYMSDYDVMDFDGNNFILGEFTRKPKTFTENEEPLYFVKGDMLISIDSDNIATKKLAISNGFKSYVTDDLDEFYFKCNTGNDYVAIIYPTDPREKFKIGQMITLFEAGENGEDLTTLIKDMYIEDDEYRIRISDLTSSTIEDSKMVTLYEEAVFIDDTISSNQSNGKFEWRYNSNTNSLDLVVLD